VKDFLSVSFDPKRSREEVLEFRALLDSKGELEENRDIKPFFESHHQLAVLLGSFSRDLIRYDRLSFQYQLFGDFSCDLVVGDSQRNAYGFVEFEEATVTSIFHRQGKKATPEWSSCYEHGLGQIMDWFWKLDDMVDTDDYEARFGGRHVSYFGLLVVGRSASLTSLQEQQRWAWRRRKVIINSLQILQFTYDELCRDLLATLEARY
jgi:hypothetical protein